MQTDWIGISVTLVILLFLMLIVWAKVQGDRIVDVLEQIRDFARGDQ